MTTSCELCGARMPPNQVPSHQRSKTCLKNRVEYEMRQRDLVPASQVWATLNTQGFDMVRARAPDKRLYAPAWAVYTAKAFAPNLHLAGYTNAGRLRHRALSHLLTQPELQNAIVSAWALAGAPAVKRLLQGIGEERKWW